MWKAAIEVVGTVAGYMLAKLDKPKKRKPSRQVQVVRLVASEPHHQSGAGEELLAYTA